MSKRATIPYDKDARLGFVWTIWGLTKKDRCDLIAIATTEEARDRYVKFTEAQPKYSAAHSEKAFVNHLYGRGMLAALNKSSGY